MVFKTTEFVGKLTVSVKRENALANWPEMLEVLLAPTIEKYRVSYFFINSWRKPFFEQPLENLKIYRHM